MVNAARSIDNLSAADWVNKTEIEHSGSVSLANVVERMMAKLDELAKPGDQAKVVEHIQFVSAEPEADIW